MDTETGDNILTAHIQTETNKPPLLAAVSSAVWSWTSVSKV